jgi:amidase
MPNRLTLARMCTQIRDGKLSPVELMDAHLRQIHKCNPAINAFVSVYEEQARAAALKAQNTKATGPLHGIPVTIKDSLDLQDQPTLCGSRLNIGHKASTDSTVARKLRAAGAIVIGKTNCPEFLMNYETDNRTTGRTNNPWNLDFTPGGSSGGESAAIAAFCSPGGIGSDGGGSIRIPASFTGIAGLKPTPGRISAAGHCPAIAHPGGLLGVVGPMARTAEDLQILFNVLHGYDIDDPFSVPLPLREIEIAGIKVGAMEQFYDVPVQPAVRQAVQIAAAALEQIGIPVEPFRPQGLENAPNLWWFFFGELSAPFIRASIAGRESETHWTGTEFIDTVAERAITGKEVVEKLGERDRLRASLLHQMRDHRVLLLPACGVAPFRHRERRWETGAKSIGLFEAMMPATLLNTLGLPGIVIPFGVSEEGLPIGIQLVAAPFEEELLIHLAMRLEEARGPFPGPPGY